MNYFSRFKNNPFIIAEIGSNYDQDFNKLKKLIIKSKNAGANAVKIQMFDSFALYPDKKSLSYKAFKSVEFNKKWFSKAQDFCKKNKIDLFASSFDKKSTEFLIKHKVNIIKFASSEAEKLSDIIFAAKFNKPIIFSTGMSELRDIVNVVDIFQRIENKNLCLMHCSALYPPRDNELNLLSIEFLKKTFNIPVGFSDHTKGSEAASVAVGLGATIFEKHITLDKNSNGPDHFYASEPDEFKDYVDKVKRSFKMKGKIKNIIFPERVKKATRRRSLYWKNNLEKNSIIKYSDFYIKENSFLGIPVLYAENIVGQKILKKVKKNSPINLSNLKK